MPEIDLPEFIGVSVPAALFVNAQPNAPFVIGASPRLGFSANPSWEMPILLDPVDHAELEVMYTDGLGFAAVGFQVSAIPELLGFAYTVQVLVIDPGTAQARLSNVESMVVLP